MDSFRSQTRRFLPHVGEKTREWRWYVQDVTMGRCKTNIVAVSDELVAKLQSEIAMEEDMKEDDDLSTNIKEYLENSPFEVRIPP
jgi:hypothetical protein